MQFTFKDKARADEKAQHTLEHRNWALDAFLRWLVATSSMGWFWATVPQGLTPGDFKA
jgi:hypothetical protein